MSVRAHASVSGIELVVRMPVAREKPREPQDVRTARATDDHRSADAALEQADPAQDEGAHDALAQLRLPHEQIPQPVARE